MFDLLPIEINCIIIEESENSDLKFVNKYFYKLFKNNTYNCAKNLIIKIFNNEFYKFGDILRISVNLIQKFVYYDQPDGLYNKKYTNDNTIKTYKKYDKEFHTHGEKYKKTYKPKLDLDDIYLLSILRVSHINQLPSKFYYYYDEYNLSYNNLFDDFILNNIISKANSLEFIIYMLNYFEYIIDFEVKIDYLLKMLNKILMENMNDKYFIFIFNKFINNKHCNAYKDDIKLLQVLFQNKKIDLLLYFVKENIIDMIDFILLSIKKDDKDIFNQIYKHDCISIEENISKILIELNEFIYRYNYSYQIKIVKYYYQKIFEYNLKNHNIKKANYLRIGENNYDIWDSEIKSIILLYNDDGTIGEQPSELEKFIKNIKIERKEKIKLLKNKHKCELQNNKHKRLQNVQNNKSKKYNNFKTQKFHKHN
jgi:hypothetical protein